MEQYIKLFTPVSERLPNNEGLYLCLLENNILELYRFGTSNKHRGLIFHRLNGGFGLITHWLDLSTLTTKEKAIDLIKDAWFSGYNFDIEDSVPGPLDFINENKNKL